MAAAGTESGGGRPVSCGTGCSARRSPADTGRHAAPSLYGNGLSESMRLYPPAWAMGREVLKDVSVGPYRLRKGTMVFFSQYIVQRDPKWFPDPERFRPERFTPEAKVGRPRFAYFPLAVGDGSASENRLPGWKPFWRWQRLRSWRAEPVEGQKIELQPKITLRPKHGIRVKLVARVPRAESPRGGDHL